MKRRFSLTKGKNRVYQIMTISQAYQKAIDATGGLQKAGVKVYITKVVSDEEEEVGRLPKDKWVSVRLAGKTDEQVDMMWEEESKLWNLGINFDTGTGFGGRDWELDWSFSVKNPKKQLTKEVSGVYYFMKLLAHHKTFQNGIEVFTVEQVFGEKGNVFNVSYQSDPFSGWYPPNMCPEYVCSREELINIITEMDQSNFIQENVSN